MVAKSVSHAAKRAAALSEDPHPHRLFGGQEYLPPSSIEQDDVERVKRALDRDHLEAMERTQRRGDRWATAMLVVLVGLGIALVRACLAP